MTDPKPGDFFVVRTNGTLAKIVRFVTSSSVNHAGIYIGDGQVVEARPGGAGLNTLELYKDALWSTDRLPAHLVPNDQQRADIVSAALRDQGTPYGILDILCIGLAQRRLGGRLDSKKALEHQPWWVRKIQSLNTLICSQLVDLDYQKAGIHFFTDGRISGLVSPEDLRSLLTEDV